MTQYLITSGETRSYHLKLHDALMVEAGGTSLDTIASGGNIDVESSGVAISSFLQRASGYTGPAVTDQEVHGFASNTTIGSGGREDVDGGGSSIGAVVMSGGAQYVDDGGSVSDAKVLSGGLEYIGSDSEVTGVTVAKGGEVMLPAVSSGQTLDISAPLRTRMSLDGLSIAAGAVIGLEGECTISSGGTAVLGVGVLTDSSLIINTGGELVGLGSYDGFAHVTGVISGITIKKSDGEQVYLSAGGDAERVKVDNSFLVLSSGGWASGTVLQGGASFAVSAGATALDTTAEGGFAVVVAGGILSGALIKAGAVVYGGGRVEGAITDYGFVSAVIVASGAKLNVLSRGHADDDKVLTGGTVQVAAGGVVSNVTLAEGGSLIDNGIVVLSTTAAKNLAGALSGAGQLVDSGAGALKLSGEATAFHGALIIETGKVEVAGAGGLGDATVNFETVSAAKTLQLEGAAEPASGTTLRATLANFDAPNELLDLTGVVYTSGASVTLSGTTLTLNDGSYETKIKLSGSQASAYQAVRDSEGGTVIRARAASANAIVQAVASFAVGEDPLNPCPPASVQSSYLVPSLGMCPSVRHS